MVCYHISQLVLVFIIFAQLFNIYKKKGKITFLMCLIALAECVLLVYNLYGLLTL